MRSEHPSSTSRNDRPRRGNAPKITIFYFKLHKFSFQPALKKRKADVEIANSINGSKVFLLPYGRVPVNEKIKAMMDVVKPHIIDLIEHANKVHVHYS